MHNQNQIIRKSGYQMNSWKSSYPEIQKIRPSSLVDTSWAFGPLETSKNKFRTRLILVRN
nr:MAG TPA: hypothetical protein [Caudoviricetes sp.]